MMGNARSISPTRPRVTSGGSMRMAPVYATWRSGGLRCRWAVRIGGGGKVALKKEDLYQKKVLGTDLYPFFGCFWRVYQELGVSVLESGIIELVTRSGALTAEILLRMKSMGYEMFFGVEEIFSVSFRYSE